MNTKTGEFTTSSFMATKDDVDAAIESVGGVKLLISVLKIR